MDVVTYPPATKSLADTLKDRQTIVIRQWLASRVIDPSVIGYRRKGN